MSTSNNFNDEIVLGPLTQERIEQEVRSIEREALRERGFVRRTSVYSGESFTCGVIKALELKGWIVKREGRTLNCYMMSLACPAYNEENIRRVTDRYAGQPRSTVNTTNLAGDLKELYGPFLKNSNRKLSHCEYLYVDLEEPRACIEHGGEFYWF